MSAPKQNREEQSHHLTVRLTLRTSFMRLPILAISLPEYAGIVGRVVLAGPACSASGNCDRDSEHWGCPLAEPAVIEHTYAYPFASALSVVRGRPRLALATSHAPAAERLFFAGRLLQPDIAAQLLLATWRWRCGATISLPPCSPAFCARPIRWSRLPTAGCGSSPSRSAAASTRAPTCCPICSPPRPSARARPMSISIRPCAPHSRESRKARASRGSRLSGFA